MKTVIKEEVILIDLKKIDRSHHLQILDKIKSLNDFPNSSGVKLLKGLGSKIFRLRSGDFRILFSLNSQQKQITVFAISDRRTIYKQLDKFTKRS